jgi:hypothetical protein
VPGASETIRTPWQQQQQQSLQCNSLCFHACRGWCGLLLLGAARWCG